MERLTYTDEEMAEFENMDCPVKANDLVNEFCNRVCDEFQYNCPFKELGKKLKTYEDKQEQGLLIELPVPIGGTVYRLVPKTYRKIETITISEYLVRGNMLYYKSKKSGLLYPCSEIGKTVFLTRSEAEEALAKELYVIIDKHLTVDLKPEK